MYDDFGDCSTPWAVPIDVESDNISVDADDGYINGSYNGHSLTARSGLRSYTIEFYKTADNKLPQWFGFASMNGGYLTPPSMRVFGVGGNLLDTINLVDLNDALGTHPYVPKFQGFLFSQEINSIQFDEGLVIDHFQYGYGAGPIPEPTGMALIGVAAVLGLSRRRRRLGYAVKAQDSLQRQG